MPERFSNTKIKQITKPTKTNDFCLRLWDDFNLFKLEQIYDSILCNTMVLSSTNIIVSKNGKVWPRNATITDCRPTHGTVRKRHKVGIIQAFIVQYMYISSSLFFQCR